MSTKSKKDQAEEIEERTAPPGEVVYAAIQSEGEHELNRTSWGLAWSGLAAGLSMGFSMIAEAFLQTHLPDATWRPLVVKLGYTVGFLIVILGRQQLFTENTLTPILPFLKKPSFGMLSNVARLWTVVLATNLAGGFLFAWLIGHTEVLNAETRQSCTEIGQEAVQFGFGTTLLRGIIAGWLIALMVWLLPFAEAGRVGVIIILSYLVGIGQFSHIIAGGIKAFYLVVTGDLALFRCINFYLIPTVIGNVIGGVSLVAALSHAQFSMTGGGGDAKEKKKKSKEEDK